MNFFMFTTKYLFILIVAVAIIHPTPSNAGLTCDELFASNPNTVFYKKNGLEHKFENGAIYLWHRNNWEHIGYGRLFNGQVYEGGYDTGPATLTPLKDHQIFVSNFEAERLYPNILTYLPSIVHNIRVGTHNIEIAIPKNSAYENAANGIIATIKELPIQKIESLRIIRVNTKPNKDDAYFREKYKDFTHSSASAGFGEMDIFATAISEFVNRTPGSLLLTRHEFGHLLASYINESTTPDDVYFRRVKLDNHPVSAYGENSLAEDFAEAIEAYLRTNAGKLDKALRLRLMNRFLYFDDIFRDRKPQSVESATSVKERRRSKIIVNLINETQLLAIAPDFNIGLLLTLD